MKLTYAFDSLELHLSPKRLSSLTAAALSEYQSKLRARGNRGTAIAARLRHMKAILNWAVYMGVLAKAPRIDMPKRGKASKAIRGRPITVEEFDRLIAAVPKVRTRDAETWQRYLRGLWVTGFRLGESLQLSWDGDAAFTVDLSGKYPRFRIYAEVQKSGRDELLPMTPDAAEFFAATPEAERHGLVFGLYQTQKQVCRIVSSIGRAAGVVVDKASGKFASCHDLRRAFGTRWARRVMPATLQRLMRHASVTTTVSYYVDLQADDIAGELWQQFGSGINTSINSGHFQAEPVDCTNNGEGTEAPLA